MSSIEEFKVIRLYRAYNTILQLCHDRGFVIRHPSAVAQAIVDPAVYQAEEDGLDYDWFLSHFVITPQQALAEAQRRGRGDSGRGRKNSNEEERGEEQDDDGADDALEDEELMQRAAGGEWIAMRNAMRLTCAVANPAPPSPTTTTTATATAAETETAPLAGKEGKKRKQKKDQNALMVFFSGADSLTVKEIQDCREKALQKKASSMIVVANKVPGAVRRDVQELSGRLDPVTGAELLRIQVFEEDALAFNITRHETLPQHLPMTKQECEAFLMERKLNISQLPRLLESDPVVQYLGLNRGDIVRIVRPSKESGPYDMYRQVI